MITDRNKHLHDKTKEMVEIDCFIHNMKPTDYDLLEQAMKSKLATYKVSLVAVTISEVFEEQFFQFQSTRT